MIIMLIGDMKAGIIVTPTGKPGQTLEIGYVEDYLVYIDGELIGEANGRADMIKMVTERITIQ